MWMFKLMNINTITNIVSVCTQSVLIIVINAHPRHKGARVEARYTLMWHNTTTVQQKQVLAPIIKFLKIALRDTSYYFTLQKLLYLYRVLS